MKIVGKLQDYYDGGESLGFDDHVVFVRNISNEIVKNKDNRPIFIEVEDLSLPSHFTDDDLKLDLKSYVDYYPFIIWFCGKSYLGYRIQEYKKDYQEFNLVKDYCVYGNEMIEIVIRLTEEISSKAYERRNNRYRRDPYYEDLIKFSKTSIKVISDVETLKIPYFLMKNFGRKYHTNTTNASHILTPRLSDYQFYKVFNLIQAYQEIEMFIPRFKEEPISVMTNDEKIHSHGMDDTSFRCEAPGNKKSKRRANKERKRNSNE